MASRRCILWLSWLFNIVGSVGVIASCVTTYWQTMKGFGLHEGLWQFCSVFGCSGVKVISHGEREFNAVKGLLLFGIVVSTLANLVTMVVLCINRRTLWPSMLLELLAIAVIVAAFSLYTTMKKPLYKFGWSFAIGWAGVGVYVIGFLHLLLSSCYGPNADITRTRYVKSTNKFIS